MELISLELNKYFPKVISNIIFQYLGNKKNNYYVCYVCSRVNSIIPLNELCSSFGVINKNELVFLKSCYHKKDYCLKCQAYIYESNMRQKCFKTKLMRNKYREIYIYNTLKIKI